MPDAHPPTRNSAGTAVSPWTIRLAYDDVSDRLSLTCDRPESEWAGSIHLSLTFEAASLDEALTHLERFADSANAVRLF